jgi:urease accessory protein
MCSLPPTSEALLASAAAPRASRLELQFKPDLNGRTFIAKQYADYPFHVCKTHYLDERPAGMATLYLQSCSGGFFENDKLTLCVTAAERAAVHLTSQASTIVHSARGAGKADHHGTILANSHALVEYLPDPIILFPGSRLTTHLDLQFAEGASIIFCESFLLHDPSGSNAFPSLLDSCVNARLVDGTLIARDRMRIEGDAWHAQLPGALGRWRCHGFMMILTSSVASDILCRELRHAFSSIAGVYAGASLLPGNKGVCARILSGEAVPIKKALTGAWEASRRLLCGSKPVPRRK